MAIQGIGSLLGNGKSSEVLERIGNTRAKETEKRSFQDTLELLSDRKDEYGLEEPGYRLSDVAQIVADKANENDVPYSNMAKDGVIEYNGVVFLCDPDKHAITLGDMSNYGDVLIIPLEEGGTLMVNRNSIGGLSKAIGMFSPRDVGRIMRAIATDTRVQSMQREIEETKDSIIGT